MLNENSVKKKQNICLEKPELVGHRGHSSWHEIQLGLFLIKKKKKILTSF